MYRKFYQRLDAWEKKKTKEPLMVIGVRQTGKTWIINKFCENTYKDYVYVNFESNPDVISLFERNLEPEYIVNQLEILYGKKITEDMAIFFDEIQRSERAITSLKYFCESEKNYRVICAGSLLGVKLHRFESSFPVGKVKISYLFPFDFEEFLLACKQELLRDAIQKACHAMQPLPDAIHQKALRYYRDFLFVGGMPGCIRSYIENENHIMDFDRSIQENLLLAYASDMTKYTISAAEGVKINEIYQSIPRQLAHENPKFKYKEIRTHANKRDFKESLDWLVASKMVYKVEKITMPESPLKAYADENNFKIYLSDTGLLCKLAGVQYNNLVAEEHNIFKGAIAENYVIQSLVSKEYTPYYFKPSDSMEIDVLLDASGKILPVEVKSGRHKRSTSLKNYYAKYSPDKMVRISENNFGVVNFIISLPLYALFCFEFNGSV